MSIMRMIGVLNAWEDKSHACIYMTYDGLIKIASNMRNDSIQATINIVETRVNQVTPDSLS